MFQCFFNEFIDRKVCGESRLRFQIVGTDKAVGAIMPKDAFCGECPEQNQVYARSASLVTGSGLGNGVSGAGLFYSADLRS